MVAVKLTLRCPLTQASHPLISTPLVLTLIRPCAAVQRGCIVMGGEGALQTSSVAAQAVPGYCECPVTSQLSLVLLIFPTNMVRRTACPEYSLLVQQMHVLGRITCPSDVLHSQPVFSLLVSKSWPGPSHLSLYCFRKLPLPILVEPYDLTS